MTASPDISKSIGKSQIAYEWIRERIAVGAFGPGYRLVLSSLAADLSMSVVPVREAVRALTAEGLVTFERNVGARVALVDGAQLRFALQAIGIVESAATSLAAPLLTAADLARARELNDIVRKGLPDLDPRVFRAVNQELHRALYAPCPNPRLLEMLRAEWARVGHLRDQGTGIVPGRAAAAVDEHEALIALIESGAEPVEIERVVRHHRDGFFSADLAARHPTTGACDISDLSEGA